MNFNTLAYNIINKTQFVCYLLSKPNVTQLKATLKQLALELDTVAKCSTTHPTPPLPLVFELYSKDLPKLIASKLSYS